MPIDYKKYPSNWKTEIRPRILKRADDKCEFCGVKNGEFGYRDELGKFNKPHDPVDYFLDYHILKNPKSFKIVLTIAHLDHDPENWDVLDDRLRAMCQKCHLEYDRDNNLKKSSDKRIRKGGQIVMEDL